MSVEKNTFRGVCANDNVLHIRSGFVFSICGFRSTYGCRNYVAPRRTLISSLRVCVSCSGCTDLFTNRSLVLTEGSGHCCPLAGIGEYRLLGQTWKRGRGNGVKHRTVDSPFFCVWFSFEQVAIFYRSFLHHCYASPTGMLLFNPHKEIRIIWFRSIFVVIIIIVSLIIFN